MGAFDGERLSLAELHRFENRYVSLCGGLHRDALGLPRRIFTKIDHAGTLRGTLRADVAGSSASDACRSPRQSFRTGKTEEAQFFNLIANARQFIRRGNGEEKR